MELHASGSILSILRDASSITIRQAITSRRPRKQRKARDSLTVEAKAPVKAKTDLPSCRTSPTRTWSSAYTAREKGKGKAKERANGHLA